MADLPTEEGTVELPTDLKRAAFDAMCRAWSYCPTDMPHLDRMRWMGEYVASALSRSPVVGAPTLPHLYEGDCPDENQPEARDPHCPACQAMSPVVGAVGGEPTGWQPIETAPKGRKVLAGYLNRAGKWRTVVACYYLPRTLEMEDPFGDYDDADGYAPEGWYEESESTEIIHFTDEPPTHWMPLPAAPGVSPTGSPEGEVSNG